MVGGWQSPEAGDGEWEDSSLKGLGGLLHVAAAEGQWPFQSMESFTT